MGAVAVGMCSESISGFVSGCCWVSLLEWMVGRSERGNESDVREEEESPHVVGPALYNEVPGTWLARRKAPAMVKTLAV